MANNVGNATDHKVSFETPAISKVNMGRTPFTRRKYSFPASLHANLLGLPTPKEEPPAAPPSNTRRRFSNVGDVVSRKLSNTIGWRSNAVPTEEVVSQGRALCGQYMRSRLKRLGLFNKKLGLSRLRSIIGTSTGSVVRDVFPSLVCAGTELERMHPKLYTNITRQAAISSSSVLISDKAVAGLLVAIGHQVLQHDVTWGKVISLYAVAGGLAVDCVSQGKAEYLHGIVEGMAEILNEKLAEWIASNGGWMTLCSMCRNEDQEGTLIEYAAIVLIVLAVLLVSYLLIWFLGTFGVVLSQ